MNSNLLTEWLKSKTLTDEQARVGNMIFHIPHDGESYLMFKCRRCGFCCSNQKQGALLLTLGDMKRLAKALNYSGIKGFVDAECVWAEVTEPKEVYPLIGLPPVKVKYAGYFLKRFEGENEQTIEEPHRCRFLTAENLCSIYDVRPVVCRKFPYTVLMDDVGVYHAYYVDVPWSLCPGYRGKKHLKLKWLAGWVENLTQGYQEAVETVKNNLIQITSLEEEPKPFSAPRLELTSR